MILKYLIVKIKYGINWIIRGMMGMIKKDKVRIFDVICLSLKIKISCSVFIV